ncbi:MAG: alpha-L-fucosidase [Planctomycetota bacterium]
MRKLAEQPFLPTWSSLKQWEVPEWYLDAKFGIFIHWVAASVPAFGSEWYGKRMYEPETPIHKHHLETYGPLKDFGFKDFIPQWKAERWNPAEWVELFRASGAKYIVPVAEHHDGFAHYDYSGSEWTSVHMGPKRDIVGELAEAVKSDGTMRFCTSSHRAYNWRFFSYADNFDTTDADRSPIYPPPHGPDEPADEDFLNDWLQRSCELVDKYKPELVWFDWCIGWPEFEPYRREFAAHYYNLGVREGFEPVINYKEEDFAPGTGIWDLERGSLDEIRPDFWQTDTSICRKSWGYTDIHDYKSAKSLVHDLVDIVSKNGCLLLNVGPRPDGTIPEGQADVLREIGKWLKTNGEAVYGTRPWSTFGEGPTRIATGTFQEKLSKGFKPDDIRFTRRGDRLLYATLLGTPADKGVIIRSLGKHMRLLKGAVTQVSLLGSDAPLEWSVAVDGLHVTLPDQLPNDVAQVLRIDVEPPEPPKRTANAGGSDVPADLDAPTS